VNTEHTTEQDLQWFFDGDVYEPSPIAAAAPGMTPEETQAADVPPADPTEYQDGAFTEAIDGEVVDNPPTPPGIPVRYLIPIAAGTLSLAMATVSLSGTCLYHFTGAEVAAMQRLIAGKSEAQATVLLLKTRGAHGWYPN
jgi:hypothetical protein